jgi:hypothetical protein
MTAFLLFVVLPLVVAIVAVRFDRYFGAHVDRFFRASWDFFRWVVAGGYGTSEDLGKLYARSPGLLSLASHRLLLTYMSALGFAVTVLGIAYVGWTQFYEPFMRGEPIPFVLASFFGVAIFGWSFLAVGEWSRLFKLAAALKKAEILLMAEVSADVQASEEGADDRAKVDA